jgi:hypothetical protein
MADTTSTTVQSVTGEVLGTFATATPLCDVCQQLGLDAAETTFFDADGKQVGALHGDVTQVANTPDSCIVSADALKKEAVAAKKEAAAASISRLRSLGVIPLINHVLRNYAHDFTSGHTVRLDTVAMLRSIPDKRVKINEFKKDVHIALEGGGYHCSTMSDNSVRITFQS